MRFFVIPAVLLAATIGYVATNPAGVAVEQTATPQPTVTGTPVATATPTAVPIPLNEQLPVLTGRLTYQSRRGLVTIDFPTGAVVDSPVIQTDFGGSDDGLWRENLDCREGGCDISFFTRDGRTTGIDNRYFVTTSMWRPTSHAFAFAASIDANAPADRVVVLDDVASSDLREVRFTGGARVDALTWFGDDLLVASDVGGSTRLERISPGNDRMLLADGLAPIAWIYPSPDGHTFAFTQSDAAGWRLKALDARSMIIIDYGAMGSDGAGAAPVPQSPEVKGPMAVAWSPDSSKIAFGGGYAPPYTMKIVDLRTAAVARAEFPAGYPGEMRWNATGTQLAVSTYDPERTHHETWVVDAATGAGAHLMDGCIIVWSPDDRFLAVHGEDVLGISIVNVTTGARFRLTEDEADTPLRWVD